MRVFLSIMVACCVFNSRAQTDHPTNRLAKLGSRGVRLHDPSTIVKDGSEYWLFHTGQGTPSYRSKDLITWTRGPAIFTNKPAWIAQAVPAHTRGLDFWAPDIVKVGDRYHVYYSVSTFGKNTSAIALATNKTLDPDSPDYKWTDQGPVIQSSTNNNYNAIDPAVTFDQDGNLWMSFGSFWSGLKLIQLDPATGKAKPDAPLHSIAKYESIEAPFIYHHDKHYYLFVNWGRCCRGTNSTYNIRIGRSEKITGPYLDKDGKDLADRGGTLLLETDGPAIGPGHAGILKEGDKYHFSLHFYDATHPRGASALAIRPLTWAPDGWPIIKENE